MKTKSPTHEAIAQRAQEIWHGRGSPSGHDTAIWLEAERLLTVAALEANHRSGGESIRSPAGVGQNLVPANRGAGVAGTVEAAPAAHHFPVTAPGAPDPDMMAAKAAFQKKSARAPQFPTGKSAPTLAPPESGKPVWDKPHSS